jgi:hypothetical protein
MIVSIMAEQMILVVSKRRKENRRRLFCKDMRFGSVIQ